MAAIYWAKSRKEDILKLCFELGIDVPEPVTIAKMKKCIMEDENFDMDTTKNMLDSIIEERIEKTERENLESQRAHELEILRATTLATTTTTAAATSGEGLKRMFTKDVSKLVGKLESSDDIQVFLTLFEQQVERMNVPQEQWITHLLGLLPLDIVHVITKEKKEDADNYSYVKKLLLNRFKWNSEEFRRRFFTQRKCDTHTYRDFAFQLRQYLAEWMDGTNVKTVEELQELLVANQIKHRAPEEIKKHFIDDLHKINDVEILVKKLEDYDTVRQKRRVDTRSEHRKQGNQAPSRKEYDHKRPETVQTTNLGSKTIKCFRCESSGHLSYSCTQPIKTNNNSQKFKKDINPQNFKKDPVPSNVHHSGSKSIPDTSS